MPNIHGLDRRSLILLALSGVVSSCARTLGVPSDKGASIGVGLQPAPRLDLDTLLDEAAASYGTVGYSVAILRRCDLVYERHAGFADRQARVPISERAVYPIFSISKLFLLVALFQSAERGEIDLDVSIAHIRPDLPAPWHSVTLRQAISHVSGLPDYFKDVNNIPATAEAAFDAIRTEPLNFSPGTRNEYNQTNFLLAREALEHAAGLPLTTLVARQFDLAGMTRTRYGFAAARVEGLVTSYRPAPDRNGPVVYEVVDWPAYTFGSSGVVATLADMVSWSQVLLKGGFLAVSTLHKFWQPQYLLSGSTAWHANGWNYSSHDDVTVVGHAGGGRVVWRHTFRTADPADSVTVIYLDNGGRTSLLPARLASLLTDRIMPGTARPTEALEESLFQRLAANQWSEAVARINREAEGPVTESELQAAVNRVGYDAMFALGPEAALLPFRWNVVRFGGSSNAHDSLGEAYRAKGDLKAARNSYARALELDPDNARIKATLNEIDVLIPGRD